MKLIGNLLLILFLSTGALAAATAYFANVDLPDEAFKNSEDKFLEVSSDAGLVLLKNESLIKEAKQTDQSKPENAPSLELKALLNIPPEELNKVKWDSETGLVTLEDGTPVPLVKAENPLSPEVLQKLREQANNQDLPQRRQYVVVREFSFSRWPMLWPFVISLCGLLAGCLLVRASAKKEIIKAGAAANVEAPMVALQTTKEILRDLQGLLREPGPTKEKLATVIEKLDDVQRLHFTAFIDARPLLVSRMGFGHYAELMNTFAACERQVNRAWSAAADEVIEEVEACVDLAADLLDDTIHMLKEKDPHLA